MGVFITMMIIVFIISFVIFITGYLESNENVVITGLYGLGIVIMMILSGIFLSDQRREIEQESYYQGQIDALNGDIRVVELESTSEGIRYSPVYPPMNKEDILENNGYWFVTESEPVTVIKNDTVFVYLIDTIQ